MPDPLMGFTYFLLLSSLGLAITTQAQDCPRPVGGENMSLKGNNSLSTSFPDGSKVSFDCTVGYVSAGGSPTITCSAGSWSTVRLKCQRRNCGSAGEVANGQIEYLEGTEFGDKLVVTCNVGHVLVGKGEMFCGAQGWMGRLPHCEVATCKSPPTVVNGTFEPNKESYIYGEVVRYSCRKDDTLSGSASLACSEDGIFTPAPPTCVMVQCKDPVIKNAEWVEGSRPPHRYMSTVTYQCRSGYTMIGERTQTCGIDGKWLPGLPECQQITTTTKATTTTTTKKPDGPVVPDPPGNNGNARSIGLGIGLTVSGTVLLAQLYWR